MPIGSTQPFRPAGTATLAASTSSASVPLAGGGDAVVVTNTTNALAYIRFGADPSVTAGTGDMPILANSRAMLSVNPLITFAAAVLATGSGAVLFTSGDGSFL